MNFVKRYLIGFNRTFMELKSDGNISSYLSGYRFNRTFMELKSKSEREGILDLLKF